MTLNDAIRLSGKVAAAAVATAIVVGVLRVIEYAPEPPSWTDENRFDTRPRR